MHARYDSREVTAPARKAFLDRFTSEIVERAAEKGEVLTPEEILRRADHLKRSYFTRLAPIEDVPHPLSHDPRRAPGLVVAIRLLALSSEARMSM